MKTLTDGTHVYSRSYYFLLEWNEADNWNTITDKFGKTKLCQLTISEYTELYKIASYAEIEYLKNKART